MIIGTLGPEGSFSEKASKQWNAGAEIKFYDDILDTVDSLLRDEVEYCIVPIENSLEGSIAITLDLLMEHELEITGEVIVKIEHCLLSKGKMDDIKIILSHPQALSQCKNFIKKNLKNAEVRSALSTSIGARLAAASRNMAAIASRESAGRYGLDILSENIQDRNENYTRFAVIGKKTPPMTGNDKTSIIVQLEKNRPGALYEILGLFADKRIDLTKIESRPAKKTLGDYIFYIDLRGHIENGMIRDTLEEVKSRAGKLKVIGSYPAANNL